jgi:hypothetical protein
MPNEHDGWIKFKTELGDGDLLKRQAKVYLKISLPDMWRETRFFVI